MKKLLIIIVSLFIFSITATADWSESWEFEYEDNKFDPQNGFTAYSTLSFGTKGDITGQLTFTPINITTFGMKADTTGDAVDVSTKPSTWTGIITSCGGSTTENFTFYQNGTAGLNVTIGFNDTNYTYVSWATYSGNGHDQYTANFTNDNWATESNIATGYPPPWANMLNSSVSGNSNFTFGVRIWMPKSVTSDLREDFVIVIQENET